MANDAVLSNAQARLERLVERKRQIDARLARERARLEVSERKRETRRLILLGRLVENRMAEDEKLRNYISEHLERWLTRPDDRRLFNLAARE